MSVIASPITTCLFLLFVVISCRSYTASECEDLSAKISQGNTSLLGGWEKGCSQVKADLTPQKCEKAFIDLLNWADKSKLEEAYGPKVMNCFTAKQLKQFIKSEDQENE